MDYLSAWCKSPRRLDGLVAIVTGSNTGLGRETARDLYLRGAKVIMACRNTTKGEEAKNCIIKEIATQTGKGTLLVEKLDLSSLKSVRDFCSRVLAEEAKVNILINNAGVMCCPEGKTEEGFETHIGTNHFGHALLTLLLMPRLVESAPSRIVNVSSYLHKASNVDLDDINFEKTPYDPIKAYARSKAANILFSKALAKKLQEHHINGVTTYSVHPGVIATDIGRDFSKTVGYGTTWLFRNVGSWFMKSPRCGAQTTIYCAVDDACANETGYYYYECAKTSASKHCQDDTAAARLWDLTITALQLQNHDIFKDGKLMENPNKQF